MVQISDSTLPVSRKAQREQVRDEAIAKSKAKAEPQPEVILNAATKRKRSDVDEADPKLKEFLEVMQPASKAKKWDTGVDDSEEPPTKIQAIDLPEGESDGEYEVVPKKAKKSSPLPIMAPVVAAPTTIPVADPEIVDEPMLDISATDDDWLRSRTNRLLDLVDPADAVIASAPVSASVNTVAETTIPQADDTVDDVQEVTPVEEEDEEEEKPDPTLEAIKSNGRLFVRNLPYTATEEDLRAHFEPFGGLEEVSYILICSPRFMMNIQIGTAYATACDVNWTINFSRCFVCSETQLTYSLVIANLKIYGC